ncbi:MAG: hypothetical protein RI897_3269 [Verrucomicrobiota bacterium]
MRARPFTSPYRLPRFDYAWAWRLWRGEGVDELLRGERTLRQLLVGMRAKDMMMSWLAMNP